MIPLVNNLTLTNMTLNSTYQAQDQIKTKINVPITGTAVLKTGNTINLKPSFKASSGYNSMINVVVTTDKYHYLKDHLACPPKLQRRRSSIRLTVNESGNIISAQNYYP